MSSNDKTKTERLKKNIEQVQPQHLSTKGFYKQQCRNFLRNAAMEHSEILDLSFFFFKYKVFVIFIQSVHLKDKRLTCDLYHTSVKCLHSPEAFTFIFSHASGEITVKVFSKAQRWQCSNAGLCNNAHAAMLTGSKKHPLLFFFTLKKT